MDAYQQYCMRTASVLKNVQIKNFRLEPNFKLDSVIQDFEASIGLDDLVDIRECPSYIAFVSMIGGFTNFEDNGYQILNKTYKKELKYASGNLMQIQLRQMVDDSVKTLTNFFKGFKTFEQLKKKQPTFKPERKYKQHKVPIENFDKKKEQPLDKKMTGISRSNKRLNEQLRKRQEKSNDPVRREQKMLYCTTPEEQPDLVWPDFMDLQDLVNPIFHLELLLGNEDIKEFDEMDENEKITLNFYRTNMMFNKSDESILKGFEDYYFELVECYSSFLRPEFCKIIV
jgi:hypothetical protein